MNIPIPMSTRSAKPRVSWSIQLLAITAILLLFNGCASNRADESAKASNARKAAESNTSLGLEYMNRGQYEVALGKLKKAVKEDPDYAPAHTVLAILYQRIDEIDLAGKHYHKAYDADPTDGDVNNNLGVYLCGVGKANKAISHFIKALDDPFYSSPAVALANAGSCALGKGDLKAADNYLRGALRIDPNFPDALISMTMLNFGQQDYLKARAFMQRYEAVISHSAASLLLAYKIEMASNDRKAANKYKLQLETSFSESVQTAEARRISRQ